MTHRKLRARAHSEKMDSSFITIRWRNHLWFVASALFVLWYFLVYVHDWSSIQGVSSITQNYANPIESREVTRKLNKFSIMSPSIGNEKIENELESANGKEVKEAEQVDTKNGREKLVSPTREIREESDSETEKPEPSSSSSSSCSGRYIYVHEIPRKFNEELVENCKSLSNWTNMCNYMTNMGLGQRLPSDKVFTNTGWFATHQFSLEIIIHNRMKQYKCLTNDSSKASAIFVPYYAGLDVARYLWGSNVSTRDSGSIDVYKWVKEQPEWQSFLGRDHFLVAGRITWDFRRGVDVDAAWGNKLMLLPESRNITMLTIESSPWNSNDFAIPYPTYFHPSSDNEVFQWQNKMRRLRRRFLFSFAGAPRPNMEYSIRSEIMQQCQASRRKCKLLECKNESNKCLKPAFLMKLFLNSVFCLQPSGDSFTRRSTFDSILAGCIPVFFHPASAYVQYLWHLPKNFNKYSVLLPEDDVRNNTIRIETELEKIPKAKIAAMREEVIKLIPKVIYADPSSRLETIEDAFDLTVKGVLERIETLRRESREGRNFSSDGVGEEFSWKYSFFGSLGNNEWDHYFIRKGKDKYW